MKASDQKQALAAAVQAARQAGQLMRRHRDVKKKINSRSRFDIKLELDVRCQKLIEAVLLRALPGSGVLGEEGRAGAEETRWRWVVDPIDGTVNFTYGVPHACVSIALQERVQETAPQGTSATQLANSPAPQDGDGRARLRRAVTFPSPQAVGQGPGDYTTIIGVVYDPFCDELWTACQAGPARLNGKIIHVSRRDRLDEAMVSIGFAKNPRSLWENLPVFNALVPRVLKIRMTGSAALSLAYVASGRFDVYLESGISLWDIAAAGFILERAGGEFWRRPIQGFQKYKMLANNGLLRRKVERIARAARKSRPQTQIN